MTTATWHRGSGNAAASPRTIRTGLLILWMVAALGADQLLLWRFLGCTSWWLLGAGAGAVAATCVAAARLGDATASGVTLARLGACFAIALALFLLGGEGRLFYANIDWQVRDAVLRDMIVEPWPFAYLARGTPEILRAPLGMYLAPALAGKAFGPVAADAALLVQNSLLLAVTLALASLRLADRRARLGTLAVFLCFSGMDLVGQSLVDLATGERLPDHLEQWAGVQYSSHVTQAFWVPQHALSGWIAAMLFLLWKDCRLPIGLLAGALPLLALWSPLGAIGALPFAAYAGARSLADGAIGRRDIGFAALATAVAAPALLYLSAASGSVGLRFLPVPAGRWFLFELIETLPYLAAVAAIGTAGRHDKATLGIVTASLLVLPFLQIGESVDLTMRGSIPALAVLSVLVADALGKVAREGGRERRGWAWLLAIVLAIGSVTGVSEIRRALTYRPSPRPLCGFPRAWDQSFAAYGKSTYLAPIASLPAPIRPGAPALLRPNDPPRCWDRPWQSPRGD